MQRMTYGMLPNKFFSKADAPWLSTTTGAFNAVYGSYAWLMPNLEANAFAVIPKYPWMKSGWRVIKSKTTGITVTSGGTFGGTPENGVIGETVKPDLVPLETKPKLMQFPFEVSHVASFLADLAKDDNWGSMSQIRLWAATQFKELLNKAILADAEGAAAGAGAAYAGTKDFESLDRIISSDAEEDSKGGAQTDWYDPYRESMSTVDRDSGTDFDCTVKSASGTIGTQAQITDYALRDIINSINNKGGGIPTVALGNQNTYTEIQGLYHQQVRYNVLGETTIEVGVNGVNTYRGHGVGIHVTTIYDVPFVRTKDAPLYSTSGELGKVLFLDTSDSEGVGEPALGLKVAQLPTYYEAGKSVQGYPFINAKWGEKSAFAMMGEVICANFYRQGKLRDVIL